MWYQRVLIRTTKIILMEKLEISVAGTDELFNFQVARNGAAMGVIAGRVEAHYL